MKTAARPLALLLIVTLALTLGPVPAPAAPIAHREVLPNGIVLLVAERPGVPIVAARVFVRAGAAFEPAERAGLANLTGALLTRGTAKRTGPELDSAIEFVGGSLEAGASRDGLTASLSVLKRDLTLGLDLLSEVVLGPTFPQEELKRKVAQIQAAIKRSEEDPNTVAARAMARLVYPNHPYGRPVEGTADSVKQVDRSGLLDFHRKYYRPNHAILTVVGDVSHTEVVERLGKALRPWEKGGASGAPPARPAAGAPTVVKINKDLTQANIVLGHEGVPRGHPDYYAIQVMNYVLGGGGFSSRLMESVRNQRGLAYSVYSAFEPEKYAGSFQIVMQTKNESANEAIRVALEEVRKMREQGAGEEELKAAKDYLVGSFPLRLDTNRKVAAFLSQVEFFGLGLDYPERYPNIIRAVTREEVLRVAKRYLQPEKLIIVVVADQTKADIKTPLDTGKGL